MTDLPAKLAEIRAGEAAALAGDLAAELTLAYATIEALTKERDEARAYLKAFCRACVDSIDREDDRHAVGVHAANPSLGWVFSLDDMDVCPQRHITGGQVRRAMEIVGFDKLKIEPATRSISDELSENRAAARKAEAALTAADAEIARLRAGLAPIVERLNEIEEIKAVAKFAIEGTAAVKISLLRSAREALTSTARTEEDSHAG